MGRKNKRRRQSSYRSKGRHDHRTRKGEPGGQGESADGRRHSDQAPKYSPEQLKAVEDLLAGIGVPEPSPFVPDQFQTAALEAIETKDVLVTAPTGSGKTWIAKEEIRRLLRDGKRAWYTTPLKALTNSKYSEFGEEFGRDNVGILTGDRKENAGAPLIVGTTEIYRNQVFDALRGAGPSRPFRT